MNATAMRLAVLAGTALACTFASTVVAFKFGNDWSLGWPYWGWLYDPRSVWHWWFAWGHIEPYRTPFIAGLMLVAPLALLPAVLLRFVMLQAPLKPGQDPSRLAGMGTVKKLLRSGHVVRTGDGVVLGVDPVRWFWQQRTLRDNGDGHVLIMAPSRLGKGAGHVVPTLLSHRGSMLVLDPKHELHQICGRHRATLGPVHVVDPTNAASARFNPLDEVRGGQHLIGDCTRIAFIIIPDAAPGAGGSERFWDSAARDLLLALLVHVVSSDDPTLAHVWRLALQVGGKRFPTVQHPDARAMLAAHREAHETTRRGVEKSLTTHLGFLADPLVRHMTAASDFRAGDLQAATLPVTIFLAPPVSEGVRLRPLLRMTLESIVSALTAYQKHTADGRLKRRNVLALIDEFPQLGRMDAIERQMPVMAGYGVRLCLVCQSEDQIGNLYGNKQSITANCATIAYMPGFDGTSLQTVARWGGQHAVAHSSKQLAASFKGANSMSQSETRVPLLEPGEMLARARREVLIFMHGVPPTYLRKRGYWQEREFKGLWDEQGGNQTLLQMAPEQLPEPEHVANEPVDNLSADDAAMVASAEELVQAMPEAAQAALRQRLQA